MQHTDELWESAEMSKACDSHWNRIAKKEVQRQCDYVASLPPFSHSCACAKCGSPPKSVTYMPPRSIQLHNSDSFTPDHAGSMKYECGYCCYTWRTKTKDAS